MMKKGFTLVEVLVAIAIIAILASVALIGVSNARKKAVFTRALYELRQIEPALFMYIEDHNDTYPPDVNRSLPPGLEDYLHNPSAVGT